MLRSRVKQSGMLSWLWMQLICVLQEREWVLPQCDIIPKWPAPKMETLLLPKMLLHRPPRGDGGESSLPGGTWERLHSVDVARSEETPTEPELIPSNRGGIGAFD